MTTTTPTLTDLRAFVAMREDDHRIARKHREEAAARTWSPENERAYEGALAWETTCLEAERVARAELIAAVRAAS